MNKASLYHRANEAQRHDAERIVAEYATKIEWRKDGRDCLLDVGSGSGDVLMDFVYPIMPQQFKNLVGTDISLKMVKYAQKFYKSYENCTFKVMDIAMEEDLPADIKGQFDHVTSFYCLHWIQNQRQALENIHQILRPQGGDCLLVFLASNPVYDVYKVLCQSSKWSDYMHDVDAFISPLHFSKDAKYEFSSMLKDTGFTDIVVDLQEKVYIYEGLQVLKDNVTAICPFLDRIPLGLHADFMDDFVNTVSNLGYRQYDEVTEDYKFITPYKLLIAYAKRPPTVQFLIGDLMANTRELKAKLH